MTAALILAYRLALGALVLVTTFQGSEPMKRTIWTIVAVYALEMIAAYWLWPGPIWATLMVAVDAMACVVITIHPAGRWQAMTGLSYILQIGGHVGYVARVLNDGSADINLYWWGLTVLGFLQLALVGGWWIHARIGSRNSRGGRHSRSASPRRQGVAG